MNPPGMVIGVNAAVRNNGFKTFSGVFTYRNHLVDIIQPIFVLRIYGDILKIESTIGNYGSFAVYQFPFIAAIFRFVQSVFGSFYQGIYSIRVISTYGNTDSSQIAGGKPLCLT